MHNEAKNKPSTEVELQKFTTRCNALNQPLSFENKDDLLRELGNMFANYLNNGGRNPTAFLEVIPQQSYFQGGDVEISTIIIGNALQRISSTHETRSLLENILVQRHSPTLPVSSIEEGQARVRQQLGFSSAKANAMA